MSDLAEKAYGGGTPTTSNEAYWNGDIPWIQSSDVADGKLLGVESRKRITQDGLNNSAAQLIPENSIAIITRVGVGKLAFMPYSYATSQDFLSLSKLNAEPFFTVYACYKKLQSELNAVQGTSIKGITKDELLAKSIMVPQYAEQRQIGAFFKQLDNLITLHQRQPFLHSPPDISLIVQLTPPFYTFSWEQRKLGELVDRVVRKNTNNESTLPLTISAQYGLVDQITYFNNRVASRDVSNYYLVLNGEFAYNKSTSDGYPFGAVKRLDLYEKGVLSTLYIVFSPKKEQQVDSDFLTVFFDTDRWHKGVAERAAEGARNHGLLNISAEDFFDIDLSVPKDVAEQKQIGAFIRQLDNLITLHQRKFEKLTNVKKSMLEKMFPQNGCSYPEIRFKGFTDAWEQRKLGDIGEARSGVGFPDAEQGGVTGIPFFKVSDMNLGGNENEMTVANNYVTAEQIAVHRWSPITELPAIFFAKVGAAVMLNRKRLCRFPFLLDNNTMAYSLSSTKWDADFAKALFGTVDLTSLVQVGALPSYNAGDVESMEIYLPSLLEQEQIGGFFKQLDNLITLHQRQTIVYAVIRSIRKVILAERQYFAPPMVRKSP